MEGRRKYWHVVVGHNFRLTNMQAAMVCAQLQHLGEIRSMRQHVYAGYRNRLAKVPGIQFQRIPDTVDPLMWAFAIRLENGGQRDFVAAELARRGIETRPAFHALAEQPLYHTPALPNASRIAKEVLSLPSAADLSAGELDVICAAVAETLNDTVCPPIQEEETMVTR